MCIIHDDDEVGLKDKPEDTGFINNIEMRQKASGI